MKKTIFITLLLFCSFLLWGQGFSKSVEFYVPDLVEKNVTGSIKIHVEVNGVAYKIGEVFEFSDEAMFSIYYSDLQLLGNKSDNVEIFVEYGNYDYWNEHFNPVNKERVILESRVGNIYPFKFTAEGSRQGTIGIKLKAKNLKNGEESYLINTSNNTSVLFEVDYNLKKVEDSTTEPLVEDSTTEQPIDIEENNRTDIFINGETENLEEGIEIDVLEENILKEETLENTNLEEELWTKIKTQNLAEDCVQYLRKYGSKGKYYKAVSRNIDNHWWKDAKTDAQSVKDDQRKIKAYINYLHRTKYGSFRNKAKDKIDDLVWKVAQDKNDTDSYLTQMEKLEGQYGKFPRKHTPPPPPKEEIDYDIIKNPEDENAFTVVFQNAELPLKILSSDEYIAIKSLDKNKIKGLFGEKGLFNLVVTDSKNDTITVVLNNMVESLEGSAEYDSEKKQFVFTKIRGGYAPYYAELRRNNLAVSSQVLIPESTKEVSVTSFKEELDGEYELILLDDNKREAFSLGVFTLENQKEVISKKQNLFLPLLLIGFFLLGGLGLLLRQMRSNKRNKIIQQKVNEKTELHTEMAQAVKIKKKGFLVEPNIQANYVNKNFLKKSNYRQFNLGRIWKSSKVSNVFLSGETVKDIDEFVKKEKRESMENETDVPEIGGFLLGQTSQNGKGIDVAIDKFVPISSEKQSVYTVEFGSSAWVELAEIQENNPEMDLIGWFHTHPGHGLFLSRPDLKIHEVFFAKGHQIALEIDPLSENMDTAFFSWKKEGEMNNKEDRLEDNWFKWTDII